MREKQKKDAQAKALAGGAKPDPSPAEGAGKPPTDVQSKPQPLAVKSMTAGVNGQGLKEMLGKAELLMKEGKFTSAIDQYAAAELVAPNQPLIWIGRANAELGASYYNRAEGHLKQAFEMDKALLMAQYDLRGFLGEDRVQSVIKDLKEVASSDQKSATPVFLLAYIFYNTGNERRAAGFLDLAEKRSEGKDRAIYKLLREHWTLPASDEGAPTPPAGDK
jgi:tetratricopeptide (TPR) repeat protein